MYDLHCHSLLSDGLLLPSEIAVRYMDKGYRAIAITDHADYSNIQISINAILEFSNHWPKNSKIWVLPGIELTHLPLDQFEPLAKYARGQGVRVIIAHGQTLVEPVIKGTNLAALKADIDILAHPGLVTDSEVKLAKEKGVFLEITARGGHRDTNLQVVEKALKFGAKLILNTDSHHPDDILEPMQLKNIALSAGLSEGEIEKIYQDTAQLIKRHTIRSKDKFSKSSRY